MKTALLALLAVLAPVPATAQEWQVARQSFAFVGTRLDVHVDTDVAGTLRLIRGAPGSVRVASRAERGFTTAGLAASDELTLAATGPGSVDYLVTVPRGVWVQIRLPGHSLSESMGGHTRARSFEWPAAARDMHRAEVDPLRDVRERWGAPLADHAALYTTYLSDVVPAVVSLPDLSQVRSVTVRLEEGPFRTMTSRPLSVERGSDHRLEIRPAGPPMDIVLTVPSTTPHFRLETAGSTALVMELQSVTALCAPLTQQWLSHGRRWLTFNPVDGALDCTARIAPRHEG